jgi:AraC family transcriptional regulator
VRIYQAKHMLLTTPVSITDISFAVGYNGVGSFTSHFTGSVSVPLSLFRQKAQNGDFEFPCPVHDPSHAHGAVHGTISLPGGYLCGRTCLPRRLPCCGVRHQPAAAVVVDIPADGRPSSYYLPNIPNGKWFIHAVGVADSTDTTFVDAKQVSSRVRSRR